MKIKNYDKHKRAKVYLISSAIIVFLLVALCLTYILLLGRKTVFVVYDSSDIVLSSLISIRQVQGPQTYMPSYDPIVTDQGAFQVIKEDDEEYVSFNASSGEEIKLLKGTNGCRFVNLQIVQPYLYVVGVDKSVKIGPWEVIEGHSTLYRLNLSNLSLSHYSLYTSVYYALPNDEILRIQDISYKGTEKNKIAISYGSPCSFFLSDWEGKNEREISFDEFNRLIDSAEHNISSP